MAMAEWDGAMGWRVADRRAWPGSGGPEGVLVLVVLLYDLFPDVSVLFELQLSPNVTVSSATAWDCRRARAGERPGGLNAETSRKLHSLSAVQGEMTRQQMVSESVREKQTLAV